MVVGETVCDSGLDFWYVGGPNMWVSETDHFNCICCHDMSEIMISVYLLFPEEQPYSYPPSPFLQGLSSDGFRTGVCCVMQQEQSVSEIGVLKRIPDTDNNSGI